jgi:hypothetical protein
MPKPPGEGPPKAVVVVPAAPACAVAATACEGGERRFLKFRLLHRLCDRLHGGCE